MKRSTSAAKGASAKKPKSAEEAPAAAPAAAAIVDFPRRKNGAVAASGAAAAGKEENGTAREFLFGADPLAASKPAKVSHRKSSGAVEEDDSNLMCPVPKKVEQLKYKRLKVGSLVLGAVKTVLSGSLVVSLPSNLSGTVSYGEASDTISERLADTSGMDAVEGAADDDEEEEGAEGAPTSGRNLAQLNSIFSPGQLVRCVIISLDKSSNGRKISLSMRASLINAGLSGSTFRKGAHVYGDVKSREDHGYVINLGVDGITGFLPFKAKKDGEEEGDDDEDAAVPAGDDAGAVPLDLIEGSPVEAVITSARKNRAVHLSVDANSVFSTSAMTAKDTNIQHLKPGQLVDATVHKVLASGMVCLFMGGYMGTVDPLHIPPMEDPTGDAPPGASGGAGGVSNQYQYGKGDPVKARIIHIDYSAKVIGLSMKLNVTEWMPYTFPAHVQKAGLVVDNATVVRIDPQVGLLMSLPQASQSLLTAEAGAGASSGPVLAYAHISKLSDKHVEAVEKSFQVGGRHTCRIIGFSLLDGVVNVSLQQSVIEAVILTSRDVRVGEVVPGTCASVSEKGMVVKLTEHIRAFVPRKHLGDVQYTRPAEKFKPGQALRFRVLAAPDGSEDAGSSSNKIQLTLKPSLVKSRLPLVTGFADALPGMETICYIVATKDFGVIVGFFNGMRGLVPLRNLSSGGDAGKKEDPKMLVSRFQLGETRRCRLTYVDHNQRRIIVTFNMEAPFKAVKSASRALPELSAIDAAVVDQPGVSFEPGTVLRSSKVIGWNERGCVVSLPAPFNEGVVARGHLTDFVAASSHVQALEDAMPAGTALAGKVVIVSKVSAGRELLLSMKPSLVAGAVGFGSVSTAAAAPSVQEDLQPGMVLAGCFVKRVETYGVFVGMLHGLTALAPVSQLSDDFVSDVSASFSPNQTVTAVVLSVESGRGVTVSLKASVVEAAVAKASNGSAPSVEYLKAFLSEKSALAAVVAASSVGIEASAAKGGAGADGSSDLAVGTIVEATVNDIRPYGAVLSPINPLLADGEEEDGGGSGGVTCLAVKHQMGDKEVKVGDKVRSLVLDADRARALVTVSLRAELLDARAGASEDAAVQPSKKRRKSAAAGGETKAKVTAPGSRQVVPASCKVGVKSNAVVELVSENYLVVSLPEHAHTVCYAPGKAFNNAGMFDTFASFKPGDEFPAEVVYVRGGAGADASMPTDVDVVVTLTVTPRAEEKGKKKAKGVKNDNGVAFPPGTLVTGKVTSVGPVECVVELNAKINGGLHISQFRPSSKKSAKKGGQFSDLKVGAEIEVRVVKPHPHCGKGSLQLELSTDIKGKNPVPPASVREVEVGALVPAYVSSLSDDKNIIFVSISSSLPARLPLLDATDSVSVAQKPGAHFKPGTKLQCLVTKADPDKRFCEVTLRAEGAEGADGEAVSAIPSGAAVAGCVCLARVTKVVANTALLMALPASMNAANKSDKDDALNLGRCHVTDVADTFKASPLSAYSKGSIVKVAVLGRSSNGNLDLSMRKSDTSGGGAKAAAAASAADSPATLAALKEGSVVRGFVRAANDQGVFVYVSRDATARVKLSLLSEGFVPKPEEAYKAGTLVTGKVMSINRKTKKVEMSLRASDISAKAQLTLEKINSGMVLRGAIKSITKFGVFVNIANSSVTGMCHNSNLKDTAGKEKVTDASKVVSVGQSVRVKVLKVDNDKGKVDLGMKKSLFTGDDDDADGEEADMEEEDGAAAMDDDDEDESDDDDDDDDDDDEGEGGVKAMAGGSDEEDSDDEDEDESEEEEEEEEEEAAPAAKKNKAASAGAGGFGAGMMNVDNDGDGSDSDDDSSDEEDSDDDDDGDDNEDPAVKEKRLKQKAKRAKERAKLREEAEVDHLEQSMANKSAPGSSDDFERMVLAQPDSSYVWIQYMAHNLNLAEPDKARQVAERALSVVNYREEGELFNLFVALMNLENAYGTPEKLLAVFSRASQRLEAKDVYVALLGIHEKRGQWAEAEEVCKKMVKRFRQSQQVWHRYMLLHMRQQEADSKAAGKARALLQTALQACPKRKHVDLISKFAQMEFKYGNPEHGRTLFEGLFTQYPRRVDIVSVFLDMEVAQGNPAIVRRLFERATNLSVSTKKAKFLFKKYLEYEKANGTAETVQHVMDSALAYVTARS